MAASLNDVVRITVVQRQNSQTVLNVFYYQVVTLTGLEGPYLEVVRDWFLNEVIPAMQSIQTTAVTYHALQIQNVTNGVDFLDYAIDPPTTGDNEGETLPPNVAWTFRLLRETLATRHGYKRIAGVPETWQNNGVQVGSSGTLATVADVLAADIQPAPAIVPLLAPVIVRKDSTGAITATNHIGDAEYRMIGTQNTRKIGRGI